MSTEQTREVSGLVSDMVCSYLNHAKGDKVQELAARVITSDQTYAAPKSLPHKLISYVRGRSFQVTKDNLLQFEKLLREGSVRLSLPLSEHKRVKSEGGLTQIVQQSIDTIFSEAIKDMNASQKQELQEIIGRIKSSAESVQEVFPGMGDDDFQALQSLATVKDSKELEKIKESLYAFCDRKDLDMTSCSFAFDIECKEVELFVQALQQNEFTVADLPKIFSELQKKVAEIREEFEENPQTAIPEEIQAILNQGIVEIVQKISKNQMARFNTVQTADELVVLYKDFATGCSQCMQMASLEEKKALGASLQVLTEQFIQKFVELSENSPLKKTELESMPPDALLQKLTFFIAASQEGGNLKELEPLLKNVQLLLQEHLIPLETEGRLLSHATVELGGKSRDVVVFRPGTVAAEGVSSYMNRQAGKVEQATTFALRVMPIISLFLIQAMAATYTGSAQCGAEVAHALGLAAITAFAFAAVSSLPSRFKNLNSILFVTMVALYFVSRPHVLQAISTLSFGQKNEDVLLEGPQCPATANFGQFFTEPQNIAATTSPIFSPYEQAFTGFTPIERGQVAVAEAVSSSWSLSSFWR